MLDYQKLVTDYVLTHRSISRVGWDTKDVKETNPIKTIFDLIDAVNSLPETQEFMGVYHLRDVMLPSWAKHFVYPRKVGVDTSWEVPDMVMRPSVDGFVYAADKVANAANLIAATQKGRPKMVSALDMRGENICFSGVKFSVKSATRVEGNEAFIPVPLNPVLISIFGENYFNYEVDRVVSHFFAREFGIDPQ